VTAARRLPKEISINRYCKLISFSKSALYYTPQGESEENLEIMAIMDKFFLDHPTTGYRKMTDYLRMLGYKVNPKRTRRLMGVMGLEPIYPKKSLSGGGRPQYVHPYLLRNLVITRPNQVWSTDISYIQMPHGFMYLYAIIDVYSRYILGWRLSNTLTADNCLELLEDCVKKYGIPEIVNTDQGSQYTSPKWENLLNDHGIRISMDGRGRCKDNIWIERFWRTIKQEYVYINPTDDAVELRKGIGSFIEFYNNGRPHQNLKGVPPCRYFSLAA